MSVSRLRLLDFQLSEGPELIGLCGSDSARCAAAVNRAQERLLTCREAGDTGWYGGYAEMVFNVTESDPYITLPRGVARVLGVNACKAPIPIRNQFYEYLEFGSGNWPKTCCGSTCNQRHSELFRRNTMVVTQGELTTPGYGLRFYITEANDAGKKVLVGCKDENDQRVYTLDDTTRHDGAFVTLASPYADLTLSGSTTALEVSELLGIQKDTTFARVSIYEVNLTTGDQTLLSILEPGEQIAHYPRYYLDRVPAGCCAVSGTTDTVQLLIMAKLDLVPAAVSTDYLLIQSLEAIIQECQAMRKSGMEGADSKREAREHHRQAIRFLQGQLAHYEGKENPAVNFAPFGSARLSAQRIGYLR